MPQTPDVVTRESLAAQRCGDNRGVWYTWIGILAPMQRSIALITLTSILLISGSHSLLALDPKKALTQYSHTIWTQADGLPEDSVRPIAQTTDGLLWLG